MNIRTIGSRQTTEKARLVLYSKPGCHLCERMKEEMSKAACGDLYTLKEIDIESDPDLFQRYRFEIPVLLINGVEVFRHRLRAEEFRAYLTGYATDT